MRQVPKYLIIGRGRLATHFVEYLRLLDITYSCWHRDLSEQTLFSMVRESSDILLLINDRSIGEFYKRYLKSARGKVYHCSGALHVEGVQAVHPLMTFGDELYDLDFYSKIQFVSFGEAARLPGLPNQVHLLPLAEQQRYHMLCVLGGNFSQLLWSKVIGEFELMGIPPEAAEIYAQQCTQNIFANPKSLTGPLVRGDVETIEKHRKELSQDHWLTVYNSFVEAFGSEKILKENSNMNSDGKSKPSPIVDEPLLEEGL